MGPKRKDKTKQKGMQRKKKRGDRKMPSPKAEPIRRQAPESLKNHFMKTHKEKKRGNLSAGVWGN